MSNVQDHATLTGSIIVCNVLDHATLTGSIIVCNVQDHATLTGSIIGRLIANKRPKINLNTISTVTKHTRL